MPQHMAHMRILLLLLGQVLALALQRVHTVNPLFPIRGVLRQHIASEYAIAGSVLHIDVQVGTEHRDNDVEVYLQVVGDAFLDAEEVGFMAGVPAPELSEGEDGAD